MPVKTKKSTPKKVAKGKPKDDAKTFKDFKKKGKVTLDVPKKKERKPFAPATKVQKSKKDYDRKSVKVDEKTNIIKFVENLLSENYSDAKNNLKLIIESKLEKRIDEELNTPLFDK